MSVYLEKIDPEKNCFRFYEIRIEPDLFAEQALVVQWGRIGRQGCIAVRGSGRKSDVERMAQNIQKVRLRHGYKIAEL